MFKVSVGGAPAQLFKLYLESVGRGACLLLNVPSDGRGLITEYDSAALVDFKKIRAESFENNLTKKGDGYFVSPKGMGLTKKLNDSEVATFESVSNPHLQSMGIEFKRTTKINCVVLKENLIKGQHCIKFRLTLKNGKHQLIKEINGTTIGHKRILTFPATEVNSIGLSIDEQKGVTSVSEIEAYLINENLIEN